MLPLPKNRPALVDDEGGGGFWICDAVGARDWRMEYVLQGDRSQRKRRHSPRRHQLTCAFWRLEAVIAVGYRAMCVCEAGVVGLREGCSEGI